MPNSPTGLLRRDVRGPFEQVRGPKLLDRAVPATSEDARRTLDDGRAEAGDIVGALCEKSDERVEEPMPS